MALFFYKEKNKDIRAAAYLRLSIEDGDKAESNSIGNQRELIRDFVAERPELHLVQLAEYIVEQGATVRAAAAAFGCSKSTVHKDVSVRLVRVSPGLSAQVRAVLARNKAERHLRGGAATRRKYRK